MGNNYAVFKYTLDNKIKTITYANGVITNYAYDKRDRPTSIVTKKGSTTLQNLSYTYDGVGNVLTYNGGYTYGYDQLNRLNYTNGPWGTISYKYDAVGNRIKMVAGAITTTYGYSNYNRMTQENASWHATLSYDMNGNLQRIVNGSTTWNYYYDSGNHLTGVSKNGANVQNNTYDGNGKRIEQNVSASTVVYVYQGSNIIYEKNLTSSTITKHLFANGLQLGKITGGNSYYFAQDNLGSTRVATTSAGVVEFSADYLPYGLLYNPSSFAEVFRYTGALYDSLTGLYYFGSRFYDPLSGRFITEDSFSGSINDPQSQNRYIYALDNPLRFTDPTGHMAGSPARMMTVDSDLKSSVSITSFSATSTSSYSETLTSSQGSFLTTTVYEVSTTTITTTTVTLTTYFDENGNPVSTSTDTEVTTSTSTSSTLLSSSQSDTSQTTETPAPTSATTTTTTTSASNCATVPYESEYTTPQGAPIDLLGGLYYDFVTIPLTGVFAIGVEALSPMSTSDNPDWYYYTLNAGLAFDSARGGGSPMEGCHWT